MAMKKLLLVMAGTMSFATLGIAAGAEAATLSGTLGGQLKATGGNINVKISPGSARFTSELYLGDRFLGSNRETKTVSLGSLPAGKLLPFKLLIKDTGDTFFMGPGSLNPDGFAHALVDLKSPGIADVGFEDIFNGGDKDYNDHVFRFSGAIAPVPEPASTLGVLAFGALGGGSWVRRKLKQTSLAR